MLAIVSDLHLTDATTANNVNPEAFELLGSDILEMAARRGAREIHLVLLGDILDRCAPTTGTAAASRWSAVPGAVHSIPARP